MRPQIASGRDDSIREHDESTAPLESRDKHCVLSRVVSLTKSACSLESSTRAKQTRATGLTKHAHTEHKQRIGRSPPQRKPPLKARHTATANSALADTTQSRLNDLSAYQRVGIHKE